MLTKAEVEAIIGSYTTRTTVIDNGPGLFKHMDVEILKDGEKVGSYRRNYGSLIHTFAPFVLDGQAYALYSPNYTATRIMRLPECEDLGGEEPHSGGFCPAEYYIPYDPERGLTGHWGFVSGCVWGDDSSMKVAYLDLSRVAEGILSRDHRFGYLPLPTGMPLKQAINLDYYRQDDEYQEIEFSVLRVYSMKEQKFTDDGH